MTAALPEGRSPGMVALRDAARRLAPTRLPVLVLGESGTGKERLARALHALSDRSAGPFVAVDCAALPAGLVQSELFGHARGAFTGAVRAREGVFQTADGGTLLLDEVADLPASAQAALLRTLAEGEVKPVGAARPVRVDVRVVAATSQPLADRVAAGAFRADLHHRLAGATLHLPPLRERGDDVLALAAVLLADAAVRAGRPGLLLGVGAVRALRAARWPGNVRQLRNVLERAAVLAPGDELTAADVSAPAATPPPPLREARAAFERAYLEDLLRSTAGNVSAAARRAGVHRTELHRLLRRHGIQAGAFRRGSGAT